MHKNIQVTLVFFLNFILSSQEKVLVYCPSYLSHTAGLGDQFQLAAGLFFLSKVVDRAFYIDSSSTLAFFQKRALRQFSCSKVYIGTSNENHLSHILDDNSHTLCIDGETNTYRYDALCLLYSARLDTALDPFTHADRFFSRQKGALLRELFQRTVPQWHKRFSYISVHIRSGDRYLLNDTTNTDDRIVLSDNNVKIIRTCLARLLQPGEMLFFTTDDARNWRFFKNIAFNKPTRARHIGLQTLNINDTIQLYKDFYYLSRSRLVLTTGSQFSFSAAAMANTSPIDIQTCKPFPCPFCKSALYAKLFLKWGGVM